MIAEPKHEINLMPREVTEKRLRRLYLARISRMLNRLYPLLVLLLAAEFVIYFSLVLVRDDIMLSEANGLQSSRDIAESAKQINELLLEVEKRTSVHNAWTPQLQEILSVLPDEMKLNAIGVIEKDDSLVIEGESSLSSAVVAFQKELEALLWVERVESPLQNFALDPGAEFSFSVYRKGLEDND